MHASRNFISYEGTREESLESLCFKVEGGLSQINFGHSFVLDKL